MGKWKFQEANDKKKKKDSVIKIKFSKFTSCSHLVKNFKWSQKTL